VTLKGEQLPLDLRLIREPLLEAFVPGPNAEALAAVKAAVADQGESYLYLWGEPGCGRTHLLLGACRAREQQGGRALYLDLSQAADLEPHLVQDLEQLDLVALDELQRIAAQRPWLEALFDLFNRLQLSGTRLLAAADRPAAQLPLALPDLRSRLASGPGYRLRPLDDAGRLELLAGSAQARGMRLPPEVARYILYRCPRDPRSLEQLMDRLDEASLAAQRAPSIPLVRALLEPGASPPD
jgi:DnaA family protein